MEILPAGTRGGARAPQIRCFRRIDTETAGVSRWLPISDAEFQADQREKSALEKCADKVVKVPPFAEAVSEEVMHEPKPQIRESDFGTFFRFLGVLLLRRGC